ncbi:MAG: tRNA lysidine(34) synthetase TilS [Armatimonadetes bacterium]|nr:tRNA lysidine(34) synthetase TilS [Armatimonadota bacterium]
MPKASSVVVEGLRDWEYIPAPEVVTNKVKEAIAKFQMLKHEERIVVGVSGGPDSLTLLHLLWRLRSEFRWQVFVAHFNHGLRGEESDEDEKFVKDFCKRLQVTCFSKKVNVMALAHEQKFSVAQAGRRARYQFFAEVASQVGASKVALGHTATDAIETLLLNLFRGTGTDGLQGIPPISPLTILEEQIESESQIWLVRPLILCWREETEVYSQIYRLQPRLDKSNLDTKIQRNWIRLELMPMLRRRFGKVDDALWRLCELARDESAFLNQTANEQLSKMLLHADKQKIAVYRNELLKVPKALQRRIFRLMVEQILGQLNEVNLEHIEEALGIIERHFSDASYHLPQGLFMKVTKGLVWLMKVATK